MSPNPVKQWTAPDFSPTSRTNRNVLIRQHFDNFPSVWMMDSLTSGFRDPSWLYYGTGTSLTQPYCLMMPIHSTTLLNAYITLYFLNFTSYESVSSSKLHSVLSTIYFICHNAEQNLDDLMGWSFHKHMSSPHQAIGPGHIESCCFDNTRQKWKQNGEYSILTLLTLRLGSVYLIHDFRSERGSGANFTDITPLETSELAWSVVWKSFPL